MKTILISCIVSCSLLLCCAPKQMVSREFPVHNTLIEAGKISVSIKDNRKRIDQTEIEIPFSPYPGQNDLRYPPLPDNLASLFEKKLSKIQGKGNPEILFTIEVEKARKGWSVGSVRKNQTTEVHYFISVTAQENVLLVGPGRFQRSEPVVNLSVESINLLFDSALHAALERFLNHEDNIRVLNANLTRLTSKAPETPPLSDMDTDIQETEIIVETNPDQTDTEPENNP